MQLTRAVSEVTSSFLVYTVSNQSYDWFYHILVFSSIIFHYIFIISMILTWSLGACHKFGSAEGEIRDSKTLKRIDVMNRDPGRILFIDDSPEAVQLCAKNALIVKPFTDVYDTKDRALLDLIPLLQVRIESLVLLYVLHIESIERLFYNVLVNTIQSNDRLLCTKGYKISELLLIPWAHMTLKKPYTNMNSG